MTSNACDIRLDRRADGWLVTVTSAGHSDTFQRLVQHGEGAAQEAARAGVLMAQHRAPQGKPMITARGMGAIHIKIEANAQKLDCVMRQNHLNRSRRPQP